MPLSITPSISVAITNLPLPKGLSQSPLFPMHVFGEDISTSIARGWWQWPHWCRPRWWIGPVNSLTAIDARERQLLNELHWWLVTLPIFVRCQRLMARKIAELFGLNCGVRPFYAACYSDELSRGSVLCLLNASFKKAVSQRHNSTFWAKIDHHGVLWGNTGKILAQWWRIMASRVALDLPYWVMSSALFCLICMAIEMVRKAGPFFSLINFMSCITVAKWPCYGPIIVHYYVIS